MTPNRSVVSGSRVPPTKSSKPHQGGDKQRAQDPNIANPRLLVNRPCIYERHLPGGAYITAHIQRLQHGYYSSKALSDTDYDHVDFFAVDFVFHCPNTQSHRFKSATIRASVHAPPRQIPSSPPHYPDDFPSGSPRFLMHAPHLIYGAVSPETLQWTFSLAGSLGVSEPPVSANFMPSGSMYGSYRHYEMMKIQGSSRTLRSRHSRALDIENGQVVWTLEENNLQKSGLPREFTFAVLIQKPGSDTKLGLTLDIDPVVQSWFGTYPRWWISQPRFLAVKTKVDFRHQIGQRFEPVSVSSRGRGFNFADLVSSFDAYVNMPGRKFSTSMNSENMDMNMNMNIQDRPESDRRYRYPPVSVPLPAIRPNETLTRELDKELDGDRDRHRKKAPAIVPVPQVQVQVLKTSIQPLSLARAQPLHPSPGRTLRRSKSVEALRKLSKLHERLVNQK